MKESTSIPKRLNRIKRLADDYFFLEKGDFIEKHDELLRVADIRGNSSKKHPHRKYRIYISRRALKHFVEERKEGFLIKHSEEAALAAIHFAIEMIPDVIMDCDRHEHEPKLEPPKHFYSKDYSYCGRPLVRILVEEKEHTLEIRSIHFQTRTNQQQ